MTNPSQWLRLNVYSLLLLLLSVMTAAATVTGFVIGAHWIVVVCFAVTASLLFRKSLHVLSMYEDKCRVMMRLKARLLDRYDERYLMPYMSTACYRHMVYFTLYDLGLQGKYRELLRHYKSMSAVREAPRVVRLQMNGGKLVMSAQDPISGKYEEL